MSPSWAPTSPAREVVSRGDGSITKGFRNAVSRILAWPGVPRMQCAGKVVTKSGVSLNSRWPATWSSELATIRMPFSWACRVNRSRAGMISTLPGT